MIAIHQSDQGSTESFNANRRSVRLGEMQPRGRCYSVGIMTGRAAGIYKNRIQPVGKRSLLSGRCCGQARERDQNLHYDSLSQPYWMVKPRHVTVVLFTWPGMRACRSETRWFPTAAIPLPPGVHLATALPS